MSRYTGPAYKKSRKLGFSCLENGKELARRPYAQNCSRTGFVQFGVLTNDLPQ